ncbi:MAG: guanylate kinase [Thermodesulfobacteriota bacterium]|nr:MAG: guanylate kinase [Thermodesulfobacteriota bacterium]
MGGIPFIVSAPSGAGKTTLCKMAVDFFPDLRHSVSYTTRPPRPGETDGADYCFVDDAEFDRMVEAGEFLEHAGVHGKRYGTARAGLAAVTALGLDIILDIDVQGAEKIRRNLSGGVYIFIVPPSIDECRRRLTARAKDSDTEIDRRLKIALEEISRAPEYEYIIVNDELDKAFDRLKSIIIAERSKSSRMMDKVKKLFGASGRD